MQCYASPHAMARESLVVYIPRVHPCCTIQLERVGRHCMHHGGHRLVQHRAFAAFTCPAPDARVMPPLGCAPHPQTFVSEGRTEPANGCCRFCFEHCHAKSMSHCEQTQRTQGTPCIAVQDTDRCDAMPCHVCLLPARGFVSISWAAGCDERQLTGTAQRSSQPPANGAWRMGAMSCRTS